MGLVRLQGEFKGHFVGGKDITVEPNEQYAEQVEEHDSANTIWSAWIGCGFLAMR